MYVFIRYYDKIRYNHVNFANAIQADDIGELGTQPTIHSEEVFYAPDVHGVNKMDHL